MVDSLYRQTVLPTELIVIDQSANDQALEVPPAMRLVYRRDPNITGGSAARNYAMTLATGDIWLFLDDDVVLESEFIEELVNVYRADPTLTGVSGIITNYPRPSRWYLLWERVFMLGPFRDDRQPIYWRANELRSSPPIPVTRFGAGLMSFRADAIRNHRFDENLHGVCDGEDVDFCMRIPHAKLVIAPKARLAHYHGRGLPPPAAADQAGMSMAVLKR